MVEKRTRPPLRRGRAAAAAAGHLVTAWERKDSDVTPIGRGMQFDLAGYPLVVVSVRTQSIRQLTEAAAQRAGFRDRAAMWKHFGYLETGPAFDVPFWVYSVAIGDEVRIPHKQSHKGYANNRVRGLGYDERRRPDERDEEPESPPAAWLEQRAQQAEETGKILRAEQRAKEEARTYARRVRQSMLTATRKGRDTEQAKAKLDEALRDLEDAA